MAVGTVEEGCVGETIAALEAQAAAELARDEVVRNVQLRIYEDESRHAELAWRFIRWAVQIGGAPVREAVRDAFERTLARFECSSALEGIHEHRLEAHGILSERRKHTLRTQIMAELIRPTLAQLLT